MNVFNFGNSCYIEIYINIKIYKYILQYMNAIICLISFYNIIVTYAFIGYYKYIFTLVIGEYI